MLIKTASISLRTYDYRGDGSYIRNMILQAGGFIEESAVNTRTVRDEVLLTGSFTFRVPSAAFNDIVVRIENVGILVSTSQSAVDASIEFHDTQSVLEMRRVEESRVLNIMAGVETIDELLRLERRLAEIRSEIEVMQRRLNTISSLAAYSTITVMLTEIATDAVGVEVVEEEGGFVYRIRQSFGLGMDSMQWIFSGLIVLLVGFAIPAATIGAMLIAVIVAVNKVKKARTRKNQEKKPGGQP